MPPLSVGGGGVRMMDEARTPAEAYENAYSKLTGCHNRVRSGLGSSVQRNYRDAAGALEEIAEALRVMRALVADEAKPAYDPYIASYAELAADTNRDRAPANWLTRIDVGEKEIKSKFSYVQAPIVATWPPGMGPSSGDAPAPKPQTPPSDTASPPPPAPKGPEMPIRLAYKAWKQSHADLADAFKAGRDATAAYADVKSAIAAMKQGVPAARHAKLDLMLAVYDQQHGETKGFTTIPAHGSKELILKQLDVVKETLESEYDPDRK
ncbi:MAG TPA: hypothetical protein VJU16_00590 [Planctomycetota bacterium]|nr:hypothetical protein [Planctomycetota bacterium]